MSQRPKWSVPWEALIAFARGDFQDVGILVWTDSAAEKCGSTVEGLAFDTNCILHPSASSNIVSFEYFLIYIILYIFIFLYGRCVMLYYPCMIYIIAHLGARVNGPRACCMLLFFIIFQSPSYIWDSPGIKKPQGPKSTSPFSHSWGRPLRGFQDRGPWRVFGALARTVLVEFIAPWPPKRLWILWPEKHLNGMMLDVWYSFWFRLWSGWLNP